MATATLKYKNWDIIYYNLLTEGYNADKFVREGTMYDEHHIDHNFDFFLQIINYAFESNSTIIYDIGSYIGTFSIPMALEGHKVFSFEGFPDNYERQKINIEPYDIKLFCCAVSDKNYIKFGKFADCTNLEHVPRNINYVRFDDYMKEHDLPNPNFIKMDIEGMEALAFHGMTNLIENIRPIWNISYHFKGYSDQEDYPGWVDKDQGGYDFMNKMFDHRYIVLDAEDGCIQKPKVLGERAGEFLFIPAERIEKVETTLTVDQVTLEYYYGNAIHFI